MEDKDLELFGLGILGHIFGLFDKGKEKEMKAWFGAWVDSRGGAEQVWNDYHKSLPQDTPKEKVIETLEECVNVAIEKGLVKKEVRFKRDYKIVISADNNDNVFWQVFKKGEPYILGNDEFEIVSEMVNEINDNIKKYLT